MRRLLPLAFTICATLGCNSNSTQSHSSDAILAGSPEATDLSLEVNEFAGRWKNATPQEHQQMADLSKVGRLFMGARREEIKAVFGAPDQSGIDNFGADVMRYELGPLPDLDGLPAHLTFEFENGVVARLTGNAISF